jgi:integrase
MWIHPDWLSEMFRNHVAAAKLRRIPLKNLRHTHASLLLQAGANPKIVSERLGHHSVAFTLDTYAHVLPGIQAKAAEDLADLVFGEEQEDEDPDEPEDDGSADAS